MIRAACTIASFNYLPYARTLCASFLQFHPNDLFFVLLVDDLPEDYDPAREQFELVPVRELGISDFEAIAFKYGILELNTNVKPTFLKYLLSKGVDQLVYFDPDILICSPVELIYSALNDAAIVLTPHCCSPNKENAYSEQLLLVDGIFNLGFIGISKTVEANRFLSWWEHRCLTLGFAERWAGLFVDQKWINLVPCYFNSVHILKHPGCNVAYWNLHERQLEKRGGAWFVNGLEPLIFFHFSGINVDDGERISKHTEQFFLSTRPDIQEIFFIYREHLVANGIHTRNTHRYAFRNFTNGEPVNKLQRALFAANLDKFAESNPFNADGPFYRWAKRHNMQSNQETVVHYGRKDYSTGDIRIRFVNRLLRLALRFLGANRYIILMKYFEFISVLRNQQDIFAE